MEKMIDKNMYWRTVKEALPDIATHNGMRSWPVLACVIEKYIDGKGKEHRYRIVKEAEHACNGKWFKPLSSVQLEVTHWMPLPTLPNEEGGEQ